MWFYKIYRNNVLFCCIPIYKPNKILFTWRNSQFNSCKDINKFYCIFSWTVLNSFLSLYINLQQTRFKKQFGRIYGIHGKEVKLSSKQSAKVYTPSQLNIAPQSFVPNVSKMEEKFVIFFHFYSPVGKIRGNVIANMFLWTTFGWNNLLSQCRKSPSRNIREMTRKLT